MQDFNIDIIEKNENHSSVLNRQHSWIRRESGKWLEQRQVIDAKEYYVSFWFINSSNITSGLLIKMVTLG